MKLNIQNKLIFGIFFICAVANAAPPVIFTRGVLLKGHGSAGAKLDPIDFSLLGIPSQFFFDVKGDTSLKSYLGEEAY